MAVDPWDVHPLTLVIENYFTDENSEKTIVGIWEDVYYGMTDCYIGGEKVFDCLNIVRSMYLYLGSKRLAAHNIPEFWEQLRSSKFLDRWERETVFSALYYILFKTGKDQRLCDRVRKLVDYDRPIGDDAPFDTFHDLIQKNDSKSCDDSKSYEEDLIEYYNSPEGQAEEAEYMANSPSIEDIERWEREEEERENKMKEEYEMGKELFRLEMREMEEKIIQSYKETIAKNSKKDYFTADMTADDWEELGCAWQSEQGGARKVVELMCRLKVENKVNSPIKQKVFYDNMNKRFGKYFVKQNLSSAIRMHDVENVFMLKKK